MKKTKLPIGYYVKQVDKLLTERIDAIQQEFGLTRIAWQMLNSIHRHGITNKTDLIDLMMPLADNSTLEETLAALDRDGIVSLESGTLLSLTEKGNALFADCSKKQNEFRQMAMRHVTENDYQTTISTLAQIIKNLE